MNIDASNAAPLKSRRVRAITISSSSCFRPFWARNRVSHHVYLRRLFKTTRDLFYGVYLVPPVESRPSTHVLVVLHHPPKNGFIATMRREYFAAGTEPWGVGIPYMRPALEPGVVCWARRGVVVA